MKEKLIGKDWEEDRRKQFIASIGQPVKQRSSLVKKVAKFLRKARGPDVVQQPERPLPAA